MNAVFSFELRNNTRRYAILHILNIGCSFLPPESRAIINDLDVILHGFMLQITYTTLFQVKRLNNLTLRVRLFNSENRGVIYWYNRETIQIKYIPSYL